MATKPLLPEVVAERAKAADDYRKAHQAAIDRIDRLRAARETRDAALKSGSSHPDSQKTQAGASSGKQTSDRRASASGEKRTRSASADAGSEA